LREELSSRTTDIEAAKEVLVAAFVASYDLPLLRAGDLAQEMLAEAARVQVAEGALTAAFDAGLTPNSLNETRRLSPGLEHGLR